MGIKLITVTFQEAKRRNAFILWRYRPLHWRENLCWVKLSAISNSSPWQASNATGENEHLFFSLICLLISLWELLQFIFTVLGRKWGRKKRWQTCPRQGVGTRMTVVVSPNHSYRTEAARLPWTPQTADGPRNSSYLRPSPAAAHARPLGHAYPGGAARAWLPAMWASPVHGRSCVGLVSSGRLSAAPALFCSELGWAGSSAAGPLPAPGEGEKGRGAGPGRFLGLEGEPRGRPHPAAGDGRPGGAGGRYSTRLLCVMSSLIFDGFPGLAFFFSFFFFFLFLSFFLPFFLS